MRSRLSETYNYLYGGVGYYAKKAWDITPLPDAVKTNLAKWYHNATYYAHVGWDGTVETGKQLYTGSKCLVANEKLNAALHTNLKEQGQGFLHFFNLKDHFTKIMERPQTRRVLLYGISANLWFLTVAMFCDGISKGRYMPMGQSYFEALLSPLAALYLVIQHKTRMFIDNPFYNMAVAKVAGFEELASEHFKPCECGTGKQLKGMLGSSFYLFADQIYSRLITQEIPLVIAEKLSIDFLVRRIVHTVGPIAEFMLNALRMGQVFLEYKLAAKGMCTEHRYQELVKHNNYAFGMGLSYYGLCMFINLSLNFVLSYFSITNALLSTNAFTTDALYSMVFLCYIFLAQTIDKPIPGNTTGIDFFYFSRYFTSFSLSHTSRALSAYFNPQDTQNPNAKNTAKPASNQINAPKPQTNIEWFQGLLNKFPPYQLVCYLFSLTGEAESIEKKIISFCRRDGARLYFEYGIDDIKELINDIKTMRSSRVHNVVKNYIPYILPKDTRKLLELLLDERLEVVLQQIESIARQIEAQSSSSTTSVYTTDFDAVLDFIKTKLGFAPTKLLDLSRMIQDNYVPDATKAVPRIEAKPPAQPQQSQQPQPLPSVLEDLPRVPPHVLPVIVLQDEAQKIAVSTQAAVPNVTDLIREDYIATPAIKSPVVNVVANKAAPSALTSNGMFAVVQPADERKPLKPDHRALFKNSSQSLF